MNDWLSTDVIVQLLSLVIIIVTILLKDHILNKNVSRDEKKTIISTFKSYSNPTIKSCESLAWRLKEIFENRGAFLLESEPQNDFFKYKYLSTIYRICTIIAWIRAMQREHTYIESPSEDGNEKIEKAIFAFQSALADGHHMELSILKEVAKYWNVDMEKLKDSDKAKLAIKIEDLVYSKIESRSNLQSSRLDDNEQNALLRSIADLIYKTVNCNKIHDSVIIKTRDQVITEISRIEAWIYRDWQNAIGDIFIESIDGSIRRFDIKGYKEFEEMYYSKGSKDYIWIQRIEKLIKNLNVEIDDRFDSRVNQLKRLYKANICLLESFTEMSEEAVISKDSLSKLKEFDKSLTI